MNIYLIHTTDFPNGNAGSEHARLIIKGLRNNNINATLIIPYGTIFSKIANNHRYIGHYDGVPFCYVSKSTMLLRSRFRFIKMQREMFRTAYVLYKKRKKLNTIILGTPDFVEFFFVILLCVIKRIPFFVWTVEKMSVCSDYKGLKGLVRYVSNAIAEKILPRYAKGYMVISSYLKEYYSSKKRIKNIMVSPILIDPDAIIKKGNDNKLKLSDSVDGKSVILYSGTFSEKDGFPYILEAFALLNRQVLNTVLVTTGEPAAIGIKEQLTMQAERLGIKEKIKHLGFLKREDLKYIISNASILLVCRTNSEFAKFGFPWKLGEYCIAKRPILATKIGDLPFYFKDNRNIFFAEAEKPESIFQGMIKILSHYNHALNVAKNGFAIASERFDYINETRKMKEFIYKSISGC